MELTLNNQIHLFLYKSRGIAQGHLPAGLIVKHEEFNISLLSGCCDALSHCTYKRYDGALGGIADAISVAAQESDQRAILVFVGSLDESTGYKRRKQSENRDF